MKKNVKCNLLKSLFLTGTVLTVSACKKEGNIGDGKILKMDIETSRATSGKNENNLIKDIYESINKLETNNIFYFTFYLDEIKKKLNKIGDENCKKK